MPKTKRVKRVYQPLSTEDAAYKKLVRECSRISVHVEVPIEVPTSGWTIAYGNRPQDFFIKHPSLKGVFRSYISVAKKLAKPDAPKDVPRVPDSPDIPSTQDAHRVCEKEGYCCEWVLQTLRNMGGKIRGSGVIADESLMDRASWMGITVENGIIKAPGFCTEDYMFQPADFMQSLLNGVIDGKVVGDWFVVHGYTKHLNQVINRLNSKRLYLEDVGLRKYRVTPPVAVPVAVPAEKKAVHIRFESSDEESEPEPEAVWHWSDFQSWNNMASIH